MMQEYFLFASFSQSLCVCSIEVNLETMAGISYLIIPLALTAHIYLSFSRVATII